MKMNKRKKKKTGYHIRKQQDKIRETRTTCHEKKKHKHTHEEKKKNNWILLFLYMEKEKAKVARHSNVYYV
jgi:hypothetical protein